MLSAECVQLGDDLGYLHFLAVQALRYAVLEGHGDIFGRIGRLLGGRAEHEQMIVVRLVRGILELQALMADVPQVSVAAVAVGCVERKIDIVLLAVLDLFFTGIHGPYIGHSPGSDDLEVGCQGLDAELETDLIISLAGRAVADRGRAFLAGDFHELLRDHGSCHGSAEQIFILIDSVRLYAGNDVLITELIDHIFNIKLGCA